MRVGFRAQPAIRPTTAAALATRLERSRWIQSQSPIEVEIESGTAILRGVVATEHDRALAERAALLEAGIWTVKNELVVEPILTPAADSTAPAEDEPQLSPPSG